MSVVLFSWMKITMRIGRPFAEVAMVRNSPSQQPPELPPLLQLAAPPPGQGQTIPRLIPRTPMTKSTITNSTGARSTATPGRYLGERTCYQQRHRRPEGDRVEDDPGQRVGRPSVAHPVLDESGHENGQGDDRADRPGQTLQRSFE